MQLDIVAFTPEEIATALKVENEIIYDLIKKGDIIAVTVGPYLRITKESLNNFLGTPIDKKNKNKSNFHAGKSLTTPDIIAILRDNIERNLFIDVNEIHNLVYMVAIKNELMGQSDFEPEHESKGSYPRWRHLVQASLQRIKNTKDNRLGINIIDHVNKKYKFI